jgi:hypothetical protein
MNALLSLHPVLSSRDDNTAQHYDEPLLDYKERLPHFHFWALNAQRRQLLALVGQLQGTCNTCLYP